MQTKINHIREIIKKQGQYNFYKKSFKKRQVRFLVSKICLIFTNMPLTRLAEIEMNLARDPSLQTFSEAFSHINIKAEWNSFGSFIYFIYKTSTYQEDQKNNVENVFISDPIKANSQKRIYYNKWLRSLDFTKYETNFKVRKILKLVF